MMASKQSVMYKDSVFVCSRNGIFFWICFYETKISERKKGAIEVFKRSVRKVAACMLVLGLCCLSLPCQAAKCVVRTDGH